MFGNRAAVRREIKPRTVLGVTHSSHGSLKASQESLGGSEELRTSCLSTQLAVQSFRGLHQGYVEKL
ncbi:hypothetical protein KUCAC02_002960 [Chaenocephalus aceratus]|uniref:Uncharacterized protein n=1 Tax=Chaenocephalus aceratus TaxID=36190 RepID=A0ACB9WKW2_CHAAC|nr:hypothetical protein KUCAC02_002960 [Chaenocephalus aceratus]